MPAINGAFASMIAVSRRLADEQPEYIIAYLRAAIRGWHWVNDNPTAAAELFIRETGSVQTIDVLAQELAGKDFVPNLAPQNLAGLADQKRFLKDFGYIRNDFNVADWIDDRFLSEAIASSELRSIAAEIAARANSANGGHGGDRLLPPSLRLKAADQSIRLQNMIK